LVTAAMIRILTFCVLACAALGLAPFYQQRETVDRMVDGIQLRSYFVIFNDLAPRFGMDKEKIMAWIDQDLPEIDSHQIIHAYDIGGEFCGLAIWMNEKGLQAARAHNWVKYVEEDQIVRLPANENPALLNVSVESGAAFTTRRDWGQMRSNINPRQLGTVPSGLYSGTTYPNAGSDTDSWNWDTSTSTAYRTINTGTRAKVWIVDTGVLFAHQEFYTSASDTRTRVTTVQNFALNNPATGDCNGHGTHCAGSAAGLYRGVAVAAEIGSVRVLNCQGSGTTTDVVAGFNYVTNNQAAGKSNILSASLGGGASTASDDAINAAANNGVIPVVAAGNDNANACNYSPARATGAITVGATQSSDAITSFSNWGTCVNIFAPGQSIHSSYYTSNTAYSTLSGTSMATPLTAGVFAVYATTQTTQPVTATVAKSAISRCAVKDVVTGLTGTKAGTPNFFVWTGQTC